MLDTSTFLVPQGTPAGLAQRDPDSRQGFEGGKKEGKAALEPLTARLAELQTALWAESEQKLLIVLQAMDTGGKDGTIRNVFMGVNPQGVRVWGFGAPTEWELAHDYLWRVHEHTPANGGITIFNRSHYEDVLVVRVKDLVAESRWRKRYEHIVDFERLLSDEGTTVVKLFLHISKEEQRSRLEARLQETDKRWKFNPGDLEDRKLWDDFQEAYEEAITRTSTEQAPWYVVPADRKWYRDLAAASILIETLERMDPRFPPEPDLDGVVVE
ncbi:MAG TPA: polyphosphate kinase 2 family protein [Acidimicrobiia bacterium]|nr:polyphosphate kinase 2 family protein [Acidimicrobiia bacterium]